MAPVVLAMILAIMFAAGAVWSAYVSNKDNNDGMAVLTVGCFIATAAFGGLVIRLAYLLQSCS
jgi:uncharacterized membrane protein